MLCVSFQQGEADDSLTRLCIRDGIVNKYVSLNITHKVWFAEINSINEDYVLTLSGLTGIILEISIWHPIAPPPPPLPLALDWEILGCLYLWLKIQDISASQI